MISKSHELAQEFQDLIQRLLTAHGLHVLPLAPGSADFVVESTSGQKAAVEVKLYRSQTATESALRKAALQLGAARERLGTSRAILVTNVQVNPALKPSFEKELAVNIYDYDVLFFLAAEQPFLREKLTSILQEAYAFRTGPLPIPRPDGLPPDLGFDQPIAEPPPSTPQAEVRRGEAIWNDILAVSFGRSDALRFAQRCTAALQYAFEDDLTSWKEESSTDASGLHRFDLIARISSNDEFWNSLIQDFRTRYVIFEFKNYEDTIRQTQIYTTEKYLYPSAMRATAIIVSREGAHENALAAARGALRESGKLILNVSLEQLHEMLRCKDSGDLATEVLMDQLESMLIKLER